jgi:hypothetical protein
MLSVRHPAAFSSAPAVTSSADSSAKVRFSISRGHAFLQDSYSLYLQQPLTLAVIANKRPIVKKIHPNAADEDLKLVK